MSVSLINIIAGLLFVYLFNGVAFVTPRLLRDGPPEEWINSYNNGEEE